jgi:hypothetical protein
MKKGRTNRQPLPAGRVGTREGIMGDDDGDYIGLTERHEEMLRAMATSHGLSPAYRETIQRAIAELEIVRENRAYRSAWEALRGIALKPPPL